MRILALETSGFSGEVALLEGDNVVYQTLLTEGQRTAQSLAPGIAAALATTGWRASDLGLVAVTIGPGSFTGLRVGVTTAKTFAYAAGCEVLGIDTLDVVAAQAPLVAGRGLWAVIDAQRAQLFAKHYVSGEQRWQGTTPAHIVSGDDWLQQLGDDMATGEGLKRFPPAHNVVARALWQPRAATVGKLAWREYQSGRRDDLWTLAPHYLRASAAEEKADEQK